MTLFSFFSSSKYAVGQVWSYQSRPGEHRSTLLINKIEDDPDYGKIFHISVIGIKIKNPAIPGGIVYQLPHIPVTEQALRQSTIKQLKKARPNLEYRQGYLTWKQAFIHQQAGVFSISIAKIIDIVEKTLN